LLSRWVYTQEDASVEKTRSYTATGLSGHYFGKYEQHKQGPLKDSNTCFGLLWEIPGGLLWGKMERIEELVNAIFRRLSQ
jgi:hypothetical protein